MHVGWEDRDVEGDKSEPGCAPGPTDEQTDATCVDAERFGRYGATLQLESPEQRVWLHTEYMTVGSTWTAISANIAVRN